MTWNVSLVGLALVLGCGGETTTTESLDSTIPPLESNLPGWVVPLSETAMSCRDVIHNYQVMEELDTALVGGNVSDLPRELMRAANLLARLILSLRLDFYQTSEVRQEWVDWELHYNTWSDWSYLCENPPPKLRESDYGDDWVRMSTGDYGIAIPTGFSKETVQVINRLHDELNAVYHDTGLLQSKVDEQEDDLGFRPATLIELRQVFDALLSSMKDATDKLKLL